MKPIDVLKSSTSINADVFGYGDKIGRIKKISLPISSPLKVILSVDIKNIRKIKLVMKDGVIYRNVFTETALTELNNGTKMILVRPGSLPHDFGKQY